MPGKPLDDPNKTRDQETAEKKRAFLAYFRAWPVKKAAAEAVNRTSDTIDIWLRDDPEFSEAFLGARAEWAKKQAFRLKPDNLLANMYEELKPPKQEIEQTITDSQELQLLRQLVNPDAQPEQPLPPQQPPD
jgi:hypothetical protein